MIDWIKAIGNCLIMLIFWIFIVFGAAFGLLTILHLMIKYLKIFFYIVYVLIIIGIIAMCVYYFVDMVRIEHANILNRKK